MVAPVWSVILQVKSKRSVREWTDTFIKVTSVFAFDYTRIALGQFFWQFLGQKSLSNICTTFHNSDTGVLSKNLSNLVTCMDICDMSIHYVSSLQSYDRDNRDMKGEN